MTLSEYMHGYELDKAAEITVQGTTYGVIMREVHDCFSKVPYKRYRIRNYISQKDKETNLLHAIIAATSEPVLLQGSSSLVFMLMAEVLETEDSP